MALNEDTAFLLPSTPSHLSSSQLEIYKITLKHIIAFASHYCDGKASWKPPLHVTEDCMDAMKDAAKSTCCKYPWKVLKIILAARVEEIFYDFMGKAKDIHENTIDTSMYASLRQYTVQQMLQFPRPPITLQRLCEVLVSPPYKRIRQISECLRKLVNVSGVVYGAVCIPDDVDWLLFPELAELEQKIAKLDTTSNNVEEWMDEIDHVGSRSRSGSASRLHNEQCVTVEGAKKRKFSQGLSDGIVSEDTSDTDEVACNRVLKRQYHMSPSSDELVDSVLKKFTNEDT